MAEPITCAAFDASAAELAFELVEPRLRDLLIAHAAGCDRCRRELESLSVTADMLVLLAPEGEPPIGFEQRALADVDISASDVVVATHACGALTDAVIDKVLGARARLAALPCCHDEETCDAGQLRGWLDVATAVDVTRAARLRAQGYEVHTQLIPRAITPQNRLLVAAPAQS